MPFNKIPLPTLSFTTMAIQLDTTVRIHVKSKRIECPQEHNVKLKDLHFTMVSYV